MNMKYLCLLFLLFLVSCKSKIEMPEFVTDDPKKLDEYSDQALLEAHQLLDSLEQTPILDSTH
jgi:hypothetical protein